MANPTTKVTKSVATMVSYIKDTVRNNGAIYAKREKLDLNQRDLRKFLSLIESSIEQAYTNSVQSVEKATNEAISDAKKQGK
jgi:hypothetical protein